LQQQQLLGSQPQAQARQHRRSYPAPCEGELEEELRQLQRLAEGEVPPHPHDKKGKKKNDGDNNDFQKPDKTVNVLFGGLPSRREQKATRREVMSIEPAVPTPLKWS
jgi:hypothetical protein